MKFGFWFTSMFFFYVPFLFLLFHWLHFLFGCRRRCNNKSIDGLTRQYTIYRHMWAPIAAVGGVGGGGGVAWRCVVVVSTWKTLCLSTKNEMKNEEIKTTKTQRVNKVTVKTTTTVKRRRITFWAAHWTHLWHAHHIRHVCVCVWVCKGLAHPGSEDQQQIVNRKYKNCENGAHCYCCCCCCLLSLSQVALPVSFSPLLLTTSSMLATGNYANFSATT